MKRVEFTHGNRSDNLLHIEVPGAVVNIRINLCDSSSGKEVTNIEIIPDKHSGEEWDIEGNPKIKGRSIRILRRKADERG